MTAPVWYEKYSTHSPEVLALVEGKEKVTSHFGEWPPFDDAEVISLSLCRSPWQKGIAKDLRAVFYMFALPSFTEECHVEFLFHDVDQITIQGFNHQNPILGLGLWVSPVERMRCNRLFVAWGGTCMNHDVAFHCKGITVVTLTILDPFRKE